MFAPLLSPAMLVVDDDPFIRKLIITTLEGVSPHVIYQASNGEDAVLIARQQRPRLILLDISMPRVDGIEACREMRRHPSLANTTIIMLTAVIDDVAGVRAAEAGADALLTKPFSPLELLDLVTTLAN